MTITEIETALYDWIYGELGITTIFAYPSAPRPTTSYALINVYSFTELGTEETKSTLLIDKSADVVRSIPKDVVISINIFYAGAFQYANTLTNSIDKVTVKEALYTAGLGYLKHTTVTKIPDVINKTWEERAQFDITFMVRSSTGADENIETIQKIELTNEIDGTTVIIG